MKIADHVEFQQGFPFYNMVMSFMVSLAASPSIFNDENPMSLSKDQYISVNGILLKDRHFFLTTFTSSLDKGKYRILCTSNHVVPCSQIPLLNP